MQVVGSADKEYAMEVPQNLNGAKNVKCTVTEDASKTVLIVLIPKRSLEFIHDIQKFHDSLPVVPINKIV